MPDGVILHREQVPAPGLWQIRPPALAGITPIAYIIFGCVADHGGDDVLGVNSGHFVGFSDSLSTFCVAATNQDAQASSNCATNATNVSFLHIISPNLQELVFTDVATFVSGGVDVNVTTSHFQPMVTCLFFYSDTWETVTIYQEGLTSGNVVLPTGFTGSNNDNQIFFFLTDIGPNFAPDRQLANSFGPTFGCAYRQGAAGPPAGQWVMPVTNRDNQSSGNINNTIHIDSIACETNIFGGAFSSRHSCSDISDDSITVAWQDGSSARRGFFVLGFNTQNKRCWAGIEDALNADGDWIVSSPNFEPEIVVALPSQQTAANGVIKLTDLDVGGLLAGTAAAESSAIWSFQDGAADMVAKCRDDDQFLNVLQDNATDGWRSGPNDFSITPTGFRVDNIIVDGGGGGAPLTIRKWPVWAIEGPTGPAPPVDLDIDDLRHARPVDQVDVIEIITIIPLDIDGLRHARQVDSVVLGITVDLFLESLRHGRRVDEITLDVSVSLVIDGLRHGRAVDVVDVQELVGVLIDIDDARHGRPVDSLLLDVDQPIQVDGLRHGRPVDSPGIQPLLGDQTGMGATATNWVLDAGQTLNNATSIDFGYHVLEGVFDGNQSVLGVDGARVTGPAGMRELTSLTLGADVDGQRRVEGEIAELRIYAGALSQADRDRILQELQTKWITG